MLLRDEISIRQFHQNRSFGTFQTPVSHSRVHLVDRNFKNSVCVQDVFIFSGGPLANVCTSYCVAQNISARATFVQYFFKLEALDHPY